MRGHPALLAPERLQARLVEAALRALRQADGPFVRAEVPVEDVRPLAWLAAQPPGWRFYWQGREEGARAAAGVALQVDADDLAALGDALAPWLAQLPPHARFYGYARFAPDVQGGAAWAPFGRTRFVLPRLELGASPAGGTLALHLAPGDDPEAAVEALRVSGATAPAPLPAPAAREDAPDAAGWRATVEWALGQFAGGPLEKVVFARRARLTLDAPLDPFDLLARLQAATPACYHVLVAEGEAAFAGASACAFVSATPERLLRVEGRRVETEAVAGTRPRAASAEADGRLRDVLLGSEKDRREHAYVRDAVAAALAPLTERLDGDAETSALTLARKRHLYARLHGTLRDGVSAVDVLRALHPTPAVGGTPTAEALAAIAAHEPFDRGLYAGPIGWVGSDAAEFAVGIRSGLVRGDVLDLFSGAGIVAGSDPDAEWAEIEHKIGDFLRILGVGDGD